jgi:hypothetical protein
VQLLALLPESGLGDFEERIHIFHVHTRLIGQSPAPPPNRHRARVKHFGGIRCTMRVYRKLHTHGEQVHVIGPR